MLDRTKAETPLSVACCPTLDKTDALQICEGTWPQGGYLAGWLLLVLQLGGTQNVTKQREPRSPPTKDVVRNKLRKHLIVGEVTRTTQQMRILSNDA